MRYLFLILTVLLSAVFALAQDVLEGPSPVSIRTYEEVTNTAVPNEVAGESNQATVAKVSFFIDAGIQYADEGEYEEAERAYLRALENAPGNPSIRFRLSTLYIMMKRYKEAAEILKSMAAEFPNNALVHNNLAWIYAVSDEMKNGELALRHAREAILSAPTQASVWNTLAEAYYVLGQYDKSLRAAEYSIELFKMQSASKEELAPFELQRAKIQHADEAYKRLFGLDE